MKKQFPIKKIVMYVALILAALTFIYPFIWMIGASFAPLHEIGTMTFWPTHPGLGKFQIND